ncbi:GGDEF domain-containing protein [Actinoplanes sp. NPDC026670]|uniref:tetratricopeptide repeat-containing diguanylate cyclase n=1 Tax=Actinoplanes sp. NPDC026670 TaxID=3154700 RepID=UPI0033FA58F8
MTAGTAVRDLVTLVTELEGTPDIEEFAAIRQQAAELRALAVAAGDEESVHRCDMVIADALMREGHLGPSGHSARQTLEWAEKHDLPYLQARAHRMLSNFYRLLGDFSEALAHGVQGVSFLPADASPPVRARHLLQLGCALDDNGSFDESDVRYREVLRISAEVGDDGLALRALNNMAYNAYERDDEPAARALAVRMRELSGRGRGLAAKEIDTIARVEMMAGRFVALEATLSGVLAGTVVDVDGDGTAECLLTLAEARRLSGRPEAAQTALDRAVELCDARDLARARVQVRREQAALYAATDRYRDAYEELLRYQESLASLQNTQREARARAMQALFEADEARRATEEFRELAHRDALTGLYNRRHVDEQLAELLSRGGVLSVAIVDLDHFKQINDTLSHATGDAVLQQVGYLLQDVVAGAGVAARLGGEEFLLILPGFDLAEAARFSDGVRCLIRDFEWAAVTGTLPVTASIGVATAPPGLTVAAPLLAAADRQLYVAKHTGRDRVAA